MRRRVRWRRQVYHSEAAGAAAPASPATRSKCWDEHPNKIERWPAPCWWAHSEYCPQFSSIANRASSALGRSPARGARDTRDASRDDGNRTLAGSCSRGRSRGPHVQTTSSTVQLSRSANTVAWASAGPPLAMIRPVTAGANSTAIFAQRFSLVPPYNCLEQRRFL